MAYTNEQIIKARKAKSVEELLAMAKAENVPMTEEGAQKIYDALHKEGELSEDELDSVAGGHKGEHFPVYYNVGLKDEPSCGVYHESTWLTNEPGPRCGKCLYFHVNEDWPGRGICKREDYFED